MINLKIKKPLKINIVAPSNEIKNEILKFFLIINTFQENQKRKISE